MEDTLLAMENTLQAKIEEKLEKLEKSISSKMSRQYSSPSLPSPGSIDSRVF